MPRLLIRSIPGKSPESSPINNIESLSILKILDELIKLKEMDLYYYLMNEVSIIGFDGGKLELSTEGSNKIYNERLGAVISSMTGSKAWVITSPITGSNLKNKMIAEIKKSSSWEKVASKFPEAEIADIIHKASVV